MTHDTNFNETTMELTSIGVSHKDLTAG